MWHKQQLAEKLGVAGQQVQKDEASLYTKVSFDRIERVAEVLGVRLHGEVVLVL
jgi:transcriptional regulator with XRE-family HTH domain